MTDQVAPEGPQEAADGRQSASTRESEDRDVQAATDAAERRTALPGVEEVRESVERMARALAGAALLNPQRDATPWDSLGAGDQDHYREQARRIINPATLNNPVTSGNAVNNCPEVDLRVQYTAAIIGALDDYDELNRIDIRADAVTALADAVLAVRDRDMEATAAAATEAQAAVQRVRTALDDAEWGGPDRADVITEIRAALDQPQEQP